MVSPQLRVKEYFFPYVRVAADPEFDPKQNEPTSGLQTKVHLDKDSEDNLYQITLEISVEPENEERRIPYKINLVAVGLFMVDEKVEDPEKLLRINASSILFSAAREYLITITSRGPWPPLFLPTISFLENKKDEPIERTKKPEEVSKKKRAKRLK